MFKSLELTSYLIVPLRNPILFNK